MPWRMHKNNSRNGYKFKVCSLYPLRNITGKQT